MVEEASAKRRRKEQAKPQLVADMRHTLGTEMKVVGLDQMPAEPQPVDWSVPFVVRVSSDVMAEKVLEGQVKSLRLKFANSNERNHPGRGQRACTEGAATRFADLIGKMIPEDRRIDRTRLKPDMLITKDLAPGAYVIAKEKHTYNQEGGHLAMARLGFTGFREIWCVKTLPMLQYLNAQTEKSLSMKAMNDLLKVMTADEMKAFITSGASFYHCTAGPQDCVMLPSCWTFGERITTRDDAAGLKQSFLLSTDLAELELMNACLLEQGKPSDSLQHAIDFLTLQL